MGMFLNVDTLSLNQIFFDILDEMGTCLFHFYDVFVCMEVKRHSAWHEMLEVAAWGKSPLMLQWSQITLAVFVNI